MNETSATPAPTAGEAPVSVLPELPLLLPVPRVASLLGISRTSAYRLVASGELPCRRLGGRVYVVTAKLKALVDGP
jgi:excisionase family DNA binding protein